ncbi:MAG: DUF6427 family protein [Flavobacteriaceae bacterium]|jgi:hypothetical protein|nr:DUF6427 family protein [Flavobacteriaceae bacterium]
MYSQASNQKYFFIGAFFFLLFFGAMLYIIDFKENSAHKFIKISIGIFCFLINFLMILLAKTIHRRRIFAMAVYTLLSISTVNIFDSFYRGLTYLILSIALIFMLDIIPSFSKFKYFNAGLLAFFAAFLYPPVSLIVIFFFLTTIFMFEQKVNIFQYLAGIFIAALLTLQIAYLTHHLPMLAEWLVNIQIPPFSIEFQLPALLLLGFILLYGFYNHLSERFVVQEIDLKNKHLMLVFYLLFWTVIFALFLGSDYNLLAFVSVPVSILISRSL